MIEWQEILLRLALASVLGAAVGLERERKDLVAGIRTHMMVCLGSTLMMLVSMYGFNGALGAPMVELDVSRVAAQVVSGIGFIGAGTILFLRQKVVRGLTTAAGLWTVAGVGLAVGGGMYFAASIATAFMLIILWGVQLIESNWSNKTQIEFIRITVENHSESSAIIDKVLDDTSLTIESFSFDSKSKEHILSLRTRGLSVKKLNAIVGELEKEFDIKKITWNK